MKSIIALTFLLIGFLSVKADQEEVGLKFIECVKKALDGGLPEAGIPDHNPLNTSSRTIDIDVYVIVGTLVLEKIQIENLVQFEVTSLTGTQNDSGNLVYEYNITWTEPIKANIPWNANITSFESPYTEYNGSYTATVEGLSINGVWDMQLEEPRINNITFGSHAVSTSTHFSGIHQLTWDEVIESDLEFILEIVTGSDERQPAGWLVDQINENWIGKPERIDAIIKNCQEN